MRLWVGPSSDIKACHDVRRVVFIEEQGVPGDVERDGLDGEALHILARSEGRVIGCARILVRGDVGKIGRVCVLRRFRGRGVGSALVQACLTHLAARSDVTRAELGAQTHALGLYEALGFRAFGSEFSDAGGQPHRMMARTL